MTKRKNIAGILFMALLVLTLISFCFLGKTFARYTSSESGTGTLQVAKWSITFESAADDNSAEVSFSKLSPSKDAYSNGTARSHSSTPVLVATITNNSDVNALVTISGNDSLTVTYSDEKPEGTEYTDVDITALFSVALYKGNSSDITDNGDLTDLNSSISLNSGGGCTYIYAVATWTTNDSNSDNDDGAAADTLDTFVGMYVESIGFTLTYTAVQDSTLPA